MDTQPASAQTADIARIAHRIDRPVVLVGLMVLAQGSMAQLIIGTLLAAIL